MLEVTRDDDRGEDGERKDRDDVRRQQLLEREAEPGQVRRNRRGEEYPGPAVEPLSGDEPSGYHRSGDDTAQAQDDVDKRVQAECRAHGWVLLEANRSATPTTALRLFTNQRSVPRKLRPMRPVVLGRNP